MSQLLSSIICWFFSRPRREGWWQHKQAEGEGCRQQLARLRSLHCSSDAQPSQLSLRRPQHQWRGCRPILRLGGGRGWTPGLQWQTTEWVLSHQAPNYIHQQLHRSTATGSPGSWPAGWCSEEGEKWEGRRLAGTTRGRGPNPHPGVVRSEGRWEHGDWSRD